MCVNGVTASGVNLGVEGQLGDPTFPVTINDTCAS